jgi:hypothetical protein
MVWYLLFEMQGQGFSTFLKPLLLKRLASLDGLAGAHDPMSHSNFPPPQSFPRKITAAR